MGLGWLAVSVLGLMVLTGSLGLESSPAGPAEAEAEFSTDSAGGESGGLANGTSGRASVGEQKDEIGVDSGPEAAPVDTDAAMRLEATSPRSVARTFIEVPMELRADVGAKVDPRPALDPLTSSLGPTGPTVPDQLAEAPDSGLPSRAPPAGPLSLHTSREVILPDAPFDLLDQGSDVLYGGAQYRTESSAPQPAPPAGPPLPPFLGTDDRSGTARAGPDGTKWFDELEEEGGGGGPRAPDATSWGTAAGVGLSSWNYPRPAPIPLLDELVAGTILATAAGALGILLVPGWRRAALRALQSVAAGRLFTRLSQQEILSHPRRSEILQFVRENPGERIQVMRKALGLPNGALLHHVAHLARGNLVRVVRDGRMARLYVAGPRIRPEPYLSPLQRRILEELRAQPGLNQSQIAGRLGLSPRAASYHVRRLRAQGLVCLERHGTAHRLFAGAGQPSVA